MQMDGQTDGQALPSRSLLLSGTICEPSYCGQVRGMRDTVRGIRAAYSGLCTLYIDSVLRAPYIDCPYKPCLHRERDRTRSGLLIQMRRRKA